MKRVMGTFLVSESYVFCMMPGSCSDFQRMFLSGF